MELVRGDDASQPERPHPDDRPHPHEADTPPEHRGHRRTERVHQRQKERAGGKVHPQIAKQRFDLLSDSGFDLCDEPGTTERRGVIERPQIAFLRAPTRCDGGIDRQAKRVPANRIIPDHPRQRHHEHRRQRSHGGDPAGRKIHGRKHHPAQENPDRQPVSENHETEKQSGPEEGH